jgi:hypothetical protein
MLKNSLRSIKNCLKDATIRILDSNSHVYRWLWLKVSNFNVKSKESTLLKFLSLWASIIIHIHMIIFGILAVCLKRLLQNPATLKPEIKEILSEIWFSVLFGSTFVFCFTFWLAFSVFISELASIEILLLFGALALGLLFSFRLMQLFHRLLDMKIQIAIISIGNIPLFIFGLPWGLIIFLCIGFIDIIFSAMSLAKNIKSATREASHLLITPILVYLLISAFTGFTDYQSEVNFSESVALLSSSVIDIEKISDSFEGTKTFFYLGDYQTLNFSFSPLTESRIRSLSAEILSTISEIETKSNRVLYLLQNRNPILMRYSTKSAEALLIGSTIIRTWIKATELMSSMYYQRKITSNNIQKLETYTNLLSQLSKQLEEVFDDPVMSLPILSSWKGKIKEGTEYFVELCEWATKYYPSLNLDLEVSHEYNETNDFLVVNLQLRNKDAEPMEVYPCQVGTHFEHIYWLNYRWLDSIYELCYKPSSIEFYPNLTVLMPNCSVTVIMNFTNIESSLSHYRFDFRTFIHPSIFVIFTDTYTQINARHVFRETIYP